jgi:hypothetical protein
MKCIKTNEGQIVRVSDTRAGEMVDNKKAKYCSKSEWKEKVRKK